MVTVTKTEGRAIPWNKGKLLGQKPSLKLKEIWAIRIRLQLDHRARELALFNLAIDSKLRGCDLVGLRVHDVVQGSHVAARAIVMQKKTQRPVQFEITEQTREAVAAWVKEAASEAGAVPLSEPCVGVAPSFDPAVFPDCRVLGGVDWAGPSGLRHAFAATNESDADLPTDQESPCGSTPPRPYQT
jgi:integrase